MDIADTKYYSIHPRRVDRVDCKQDVADIAEQQQLRGVLKKYNGSSKAFYAVLRYGPLASPSYFSLFEKNVRRADFEIIALPQLPEDQRDLLDLVPHSGIDILVSPSGCASGDGASSGCPGFRRDDRAARALAQVSAVALSRGVDAAVATRGKLYAEMEAERLSEHASSLHDDNEELRVKYAESQARLEEREAANKKLEDEREAANKKLEEANKKADEERKKADEERKKADEERKKAADAEKDAAVLRRELELRKRRDCVVM